MPGKNNKKEGRNVMNPKMKLVAGPAKISVRLLTAEEMQDFGMEELKPPLTYGLLASIGWKFIHTTEGVIIIFDLNAAVKIFTGTYVIDEKAIIAKFIPAKGIGEHSETTPFEGKSREADTWERMMAKDGF